MLSLHHKLVSHKLHSRNILLIALVINLVILSVNGRNDKKIDRCDSGFFENAQHTHYLQFTKEFVKREFAMERTFKSLHCCAKGYRSIEWFKDGKSFPWAKETSSMILYPGASNQSIYAIHISDIDAGKYTCVVKNDTHTIENSIQLEVMKSSPQVPLETFWPETHYTKIGGFARFFCEAFVGKKDLPDIPVTIQWFSQNGDSVDEKYQEIVTREEEQIIGSFLKIPNVTSGDFGSYTCRIQIGNSPAYRLDMSVNLINALPIALDPIWLEPYILAIMAAVATLLLIFFLLSYNNLWRRTFNVSNDDTNMKCKQSHQQTLPFVQIGRRPRQRQESQSNDAVIMMNSYLN